MTQTERQHTGVGILRGPAQYRDGFTVLARLTPQLRQQLQVLNGLFNAFGSHLGFQHLGTTNRIVEGRIKLRQGNHIALLFNQTSQVGRLQGAERSLQVVGIHIEPRQLTPVGQRLWPDHHHLFKQIDAWR